MRRIRGPLPGASWVLLGLCAAGLSACATRAQPRPALRLPASELRVRTICQHGTRTNLPIAKEKVAEIDQLVTSQLQASRFVAVPVERTDELTTRVMREEGGYFDPYSGRRDETRYRQVRARLLAALAHQLGCDALVVPVIAVVTAPWANGEAEWDGVSATMAEGLLGGWSAHGYLPALSLRISVRDIQDREIYYGTGGIQVVAMLHQGFFSEKFQPISDESVLADREAKARAVRLSLAGLAEIAPR